MSDNIQAQENSQNLADASVLPNVNPLPSEGLKMPDAIVPVETADIELPKIPNLEPGILPTTSDLVVNPAPIPVEPPATSVNLPQMPEVPAQIIPPVIQVDQLGAGSMIKALLVKAKEKIQFRKRKKLEKILELVKVQGKVTNQMVEKCVKCSHATATRYLVQLVNENKLKRSGKQKRPFYELV